MKILFVLPSLTTGGLEKVQVSIANGLAKRGHQVTVMTLNPDHSLADTLDNRVRLVHKPYRTTFMKKIPYIRHKFYDDGMWETRATPKKLHRYYVGKEHYDVEVGFFRGLAVKIVSGATTGLKKPVGTKPSAMGHNDFEGKSVCTERLPTARHTDFGKKSLGTKMLAWVHNDFELATGYRNNFQSMEQVFQAYSSYDRVVCVSRQAAKSFKKVIGDTGNVTTIYNLLPVKEIQAMAAQPCSIPAKQHKLNVILVGRLLDSAKGHLRLISAVKALQEDGLDIGLTIAGEGPDEERIKSKIAQLSAESYVTMLGNLQNPYAYIKAADLLVCASYFEGYNLTVAEALICGTPVLSTDCTGPNEILDGGKYGMIVENSEEGIWEGLRKLATDETLLAHYRQMAAQRMDFFNEEKILDQIEALWE